MPRETQNSVSEKEKEKLLTILEEQGRTKWLKRWKNHMAFPTNLNPLSKERNEQEKVLRYLLLRVLINQQAKFEKVREMSIKTSEEFTDVLLFEPYNISELELFKLFKDVAGKKGSLLYSVGALGGIKPISLFAYRFKVYEGFIKWLDKTKSLKTKQPFFDLIVNQLQTKKPFNLFKFLSTHPILEAGWVGSDPKACRMFVNWIIFLFNEIWKEKVSEMKETLMIVDGHVGKMFCRSGLLEEVLYEKRRPYIIQASKLVECLKIKENEESRMLKNNKLLDKRVTVEPVKKIKTFKSSNHKFNKVENIIFIVENEDKHTKKMIKLPQGIRPLILIGDVFEKLNEIPDTSIDIIVTSPPYWKQRDYGTKNQIGQEDTPEEYIQKIVKVGDSFRRVLKNTGSYFLNIGDKYVEKNLQMIPFRVATEMQNRGWTLRNILIWYKPNHMPSSIKDRFTNTWEPVFFFVKSTGKYYTAEYYINLDAIRIPHKDNENVKSDLPLTMSEQEYRDKKEEIEKRLSLVNGKYRGKFREHEKNRGASPGARLSLFGEYYTKQRVYKIASKEEGEITQYLREWRKKRGITPKQIDKLLNKKDTAGHWFRLDHGRSLPKPEDWLKLKEILRFDDKYDEIMTKMHYVLQTVKPYHKGKNPGDMWSVPLERFPDAHFSIFPTELPKRIIQAFTPPNGIVLDPFAGTGTTGKAAMELGRRSILIDINPEYVKLTRKRCCLKGIPLTEFLG